MHLIQLRNGFLSHFRGCPSGFSGLIAHEVYKRVVDGDLKQFITEDTWKDIPRIDGENQDNETEVIGKGTEILNFGLLFRVEWLQFL